jgi:hypothetical protein
MEEKNQGVFGTIMCRACFRGTPKATADLSTPVASGDLRSR